MLTLAWAISWALACAPASAQAPDHLGQLADTLRALNALDDRADVVGIDRLLAERAVAAPSSLVRAHARQLLMAKRARALDVDGAEPLARALGLVEDVALLGPFDNPGGALFAQPTTMELSAGFVAEAMGLSGPVAWQPLHSSGPSHDLDLGAALAASDEVRALVAFVAFADKKTRANLMVSASGQVTAMVRGKVVLEQGGERPLGIDQFAAGVTLEAGPNLVVLRLGNVTGRFAARVRLIGDDEAVLTGVRTSATLEDLGAGWTATATTRAVDVPAPPSVLGEIKAKVQSAPLVKPVGTGRDHLSDAITVERVVHTRDARRQPDGLTVWLLAREVRERQGASADGLVGALTDSGLALLDTQPSKARARLEEVLTLKPDHADALVGLARLRNDQEQLREARALYWRAQKAAPDRATIQAEALSALRFLDERRAVVERLILDTAERLPHRQLLELAAAVLSERDHLVAAGAVVDRIAVEDPTAGTVLRYRKRWARAAPDDAAAVPAYRTALQGRVSLVPHDWNRVETLLRMSTLAGQPLDLSPWMQRYPQRAEPHRLCAVAALHKGDALAADRCLRQALAVAPQDAALADLLRRRGAGSLDLGALTVLDLAALAARPVPEGAVSEGAYVLGRRIAVDVADSGLSTTVERVAYRVLDEKKARWLREISVGYTEGREQVTVLLAERIDRAGERHAPREQYVRVPDGKVDGMYTDAATSVIDFGEVQTGDVLHVLIETRNVGRQNLFGDFFGGLWAAAHRVPMLVWSLSLIEPEGRTITLGGRGMPPPRPQQLRGRTVRTLRLENVPALPIEPLMDPPLSDVAYAIATSRPSWPDLGAWYADFVRPQLVLNDELRALARNTVAGARTDEEKARRLYRLVVTETRYVGIELGIHGWKPYPVAEVWRRRYGDCKDKSSLLIALLHEVGVDAQLALVRTADRGRLLPGPASMWAFNHAITYLPWADHYVDPTAEYMSYDELPALDQGGQVLLLDPLARPAPPARFAEIPVSAAADNLNRSDYQIDVRLDGSIALRGTERFTGVPAADQRARLVDEGRRRQRVADEIAEALPGATVRDFSVTDVSLDTAEVGYDFSGEVPGFATPQRDGWALPVSIYPQELVRNYAGVNARKRALFVNAPWRTTNVMRFRLPPGLVVVGLPDSVTIESPHFFFEQKVTVTDTGFEISETTSMKSRRVPADAYPLFRQQLEQADRRMQARIGLRKKGAT